MKIDAFIFMFFRFYFKSIYLVSYTLLYILKQRGIPMKNKLPSIDLLTLLLTLSISTIGLIFVLSSSYIWAEYKFNDAFYFFKRQLLFAIIGVVGMIAVSRVNYQITKSMPHLFSLLV